MQAAAPGLVSAAIATWNTPQMNAIIKRKQVADRDLDDLNLTRLSQAFDAHINIDGRHHIHRTSRRGTSPPRRDSLATCHYRVAAASTDRKPRQFCSAARPTPAKLQQGGGVPSCRPMRRRLRAGLCLGLAAAVGGAGCGGPRPAGRAALPGSGPTPCAAAARGLIGRAAATSPAGVGTSTFTATSGAPTCLFVVRGPGAGKLVVRVGLDSAPQALARLERQAVEYSQTVLWAHLGSGAYPQTVGRLGVDAYWFPADRRLSTTDGRRLIEVTVAWPGAGRPRARALAEAVAGAYLP